jgi:hypothetical protein
MDKKDTKDKIDKVKELAEKNQVVDQGELNQAKIKRASGTSPHSLGPKK